MAGNVNTGGATGGKAIPKSTAKVLDLKIAPHKGTSGELIATWGWPYLYTDHYKCVWEYTNDNKNWIVASDSNTPDATHKNSLYTPGNAAKKVRVSVKPISRTKTVNKKETHYWTISKATTTTYTIKSIPILETPSAPSVSISGYVLTAEVTYTASGASNIAFYIINDTTKTKSGPHTVKRYYGKAAISIPISANYSYRAYCFALSDDLSKRLNSAHSPYSSEVVAPPSAVTITKIIAKTMTSVEITFNTITNGTSYEVEYAEKDEYFDRSDLVNQKTISTEPNKHLSILLTGLEETGKKLFFRVKVSNNAGSSSWSNIFSVLLGQKPDPPTIWASTSTAEMGENVILFWTHNSIDGSEQTIARMLLTFKYKMPNGSKDIRQVLIPNVPFTPGQTQYSITLKAVLNNFKDQNIKLNNITELTWQVSTKGIVNDYSDYSDKNIIKFYMKPSIWIGLYRKMNWYWDPFSFPDDDIYTAKGDFVDIHEEDPIIIETFPIYIKASISPVEYRPLECEFIISTTETYQTLNYVGETIWVNEGDVIYRKTITQTSVVTVHDFQLSLAPNDVSFEDGVTYKLMVKTIMDNGMTGEAEKTFTINFVDEVEYGINAEMTYDEENVSLYISPFCVDDEGEIISGFSMGVYRQNFDGAFVEIGKGIVSGSAVTVIDPHPTLKMARYRISAFSYKTGTMQFTDLPSYPVPETAIVIQWNESWSEFDYEDPNTFSDPVQNLSMVKLPYNVDLSESNDIDVKLVEYLGRDHPVAYYGTQVGQEINLKSEIPYYDYDTIYQLRRLSKWMGNVYIREPNGNGYWATVSVSFSITHCEMLIPITVKATRVEGGM